jgi:FtsZ-binding cell division protein ZapB
MKTLEDLLTTAGVAKDQVKLAFHEKTNVLILRGPAEAQGVVEQLLTALDKNFAKTSERAADATVIPLKIKVEAMAAEIENLRNRLEATDQQRRDLERENQRLKDQVPQKIDRK